MAFTALNDWCPVAKYLAIASPGDWLHAAHLQPSHVLAEADSKLACNAGVDVFAISVSASAATLLGGGHCWTSQV